MNPIEPRVQAALDAAMNLIRTAAASAAVRVAESLDVQAQGATRPAERELLFNAMQELRRNAGMFQAAFHETPLDVLPVITFWSSVLRSARS